MNLTRWQAIFASVVLVGWVACFFLPVSPQIQIGVQGAFMLVLGRLFGIGVARNSKGD